MLLLSLSIFGTSGNESFGSMYSSILNFYTLIFETMIGLFIIPVSGTCSAGEFTCTNDECVDENLRFNRIPDCTDGSDEGESK